MKFPPLFILCGGAGTRLRPLVSNRPKPMAEVGGAPFLVHLIDAYRARGIDRFILCAGYLGAQIREYFAERTGIQVEVEATPLGTAGSIRAAWEKHPYDRFLVTNGDSFCSVDLHHLAEELDRDATPASMAITRVENAGDFGTILWDHEGYIRAFLEKDQGSAEAPGWVNAGTYGFRSEVIDVFPTVGSLERHVFPLLAERGQLKAVPANSDLLDIGTPTRFAGAAEMLPRLLAIDTFDGKMGDGINHMGTQR